MDLKHARRENMNQYDRVVKENFLPNISVKKQMEVESRVKQLKEPRVRRNEKPSPVYLPNSYKYDAHKSVDWGPKIPEPPELQPKKFMKIDYLRFRDKREFQQALDNYPYESDTAVATRLISRELSDRSKMHA